MFFFLFFFILFVSEGSRWLAGLSTEQNGSDVLAMFRTTFFHPSISIAHGPGYGPGKDQLCETTVENSRSLASLQNHTAFFRRGGTIGTISSLDLVSLLYREGSLRQKDRQFPGMTDRKMKSRGRTFGPKYLRKQKKKDR